MKPSHLAHRTLWSVPIVWLLFTCGPAQGQTSKPFQPQLGQPGKDLVWVPTPQAAVQVMLDLARVTQNDFVIDLGSGDGVIVISAANRGSKAHGIEYNPDLVELSQRNAAAAGVNDNATFEEADLFESDFSKATVITMFLLPSLNLRLRPKLLDLKPGTRVVSNTYDMGDWKPDKTVIVPECATAELRSGIFEWRWCAALLWIVPAKVAGSWRLPQGELTLEQQFQMVSGALGSGGSAVPITHGRVLGDQLSFSVADVEYDGHVSDDTMEGTFTAEGQTSTFRATRASR
jgi:hypothetical protein